MNRRNSWWSIIAVAAMLLMCNAVSAASLGPPQKTKPVFGQPFKAARGKVFTLTANSGFPKIGKRIESRCRYNPPPSVPEPSMLAGTLVSLAGLGFVGLRRKMK